MRGILAGVTPVDFPSRGKGTGEMNPEYTEKQGQYLAFIYHYSKVHGYPPAESDIKKYFKVTPPSVHQTVLTLEKRGLIERVPGQPRTIHVLLTLEELPLLGSRP